MLGLFFPEYLGALVLLEGLWIFFNTFLLCFSGYLVSQVLLEVLGTFSLFGFPPSERFQCINIFLDKDNPRTFRYYFYQYPESYICTKNGAEYFELLPLQEGLVVVSLASLVQVVQISTEVKSNPWDCDSETTED